MMPQALKMRCPNRVLSYLLASLLLADVSIFSLQAKSYSSGGKSYSAHSSSSGSSHSFSSGSGKSFGSGSSSRGSSSGSSSGGGSRSPSSSSGSGKSFGSGSGKSYSSGSTWSGNDHHGYSSGKSYSSGSSASKLQSPKAKDEDIGNRNTSAGSGFSFDTAAARARKEAASKQEFTRFKDSQAPPRAQSDAAGSATPRDYSSPGSGGGSYRGGSPSLPPRRDYYQPTYVPTTVIIQTRPRRIYDVFSPYSYRPWVTYSDPYSSLFWWWLLDRSIEDQAWWAYHHRYDMDPARYQALLNSNQQLEGRVAQLEAQQTPRDATYTPTGLDRDLMYSDQYVNRTYANRPTTSGRVAFWIFAVPAAAGGCIFFIWLIWFKRWQTN